MRFSLRRDRAQVIQAVGACLGLLVAFNLTNVDTAAAVQALVAAGFGVVAAFQVRPMQPTVFASLISAGAILLARFGLEATAEQLAAIQFAAASAVIILVRPQQTPRVSPAAPEATTDPMG